MECVRTHWRILTIKGWGNLTHVQNIVEKIKETSWKFRKIGQIVNQTLAFGPEHDIIRAWWVSNILSKNMMEKV
jgi:hypothetical protein